MPKQCRFIKAHGIRCDNITIFKDGICRGHKRSKCYFCGKQARRECDQGTPPDYCGRVLCDRCRCDCK
jgi:hypothetical protein